MKSVNYYQQNRHEILPFLPEKACCILEIGCGTGDFSLLVNSYDEYWGVEPELDIAERATSTLSKVLVGTYSEVEEQLPDGHFDLVICNDVIEHMPDHNRFLQRIAKKMTPRGYIVGSIPNIRHIAVLYKLVFRKDWEYVEQGPLDDTHLRFFTQKSLANAFLANGYTIEKLCGVNGIFKTIESVKHLILVAIVSVISLMSFGYHRDIQYHQFAFRIRKQE